MPSAVGALLFGAIVDADGIVQHLARQLDDLRRDRGREEQGLLARPAASRRSLRTAGRKPMSSMRSASSSTSIDTPSSARALLQMIDQASGRGDDDLDAGLEGLRSADRSRRRRRPRGRGSWCGCASAVRCVGDLRGEFARRREDQRVGLARAADAAMRLQQRQTEGGGFAGSGLGAGEDVASGQRGRDRLRSAPASGR